MIAAIVFILGLSFSAAVLLVVLTAAARNFERRV